MQLGPQDCLVIGGAVAGLLGLGITAWDLLPELRLQRARVAMARAEALLEMMNTLQQNKLKERGEISPSDYGKGVDVTNAQFLSQMVREYGFDNDLADRLSTAIQIADRNLGRKRHGAAFIVYPTEPAQVVTQDDYLKMLNDLVPEVRNFFDVQQTLRDREEYFPTRWRPPLALGLWLLALGYVLPTLVVLFPQA